MILADLPNGATVFVDANVLIYYFMPHPQFGQACTEFMDRVERGEIIAHSSTHIAGEIAHRLMTVEAIDPFAWPLAGIAARLRRHAVEVQSLTRFRDAIDDLLQSPVQIRSVVPALVAEAAVISQQTGLLTNDALVVAVSRTKA